MFSFSFYNVVLVVIVAVVVGPLGRPLQTTLCLKKRVNVETVSLIKKANLHENWSIPPLFWSTGILNITAKYRQNWSL